MSSPEPRVGPATERSSEAPKRASGGGRAVSIVLGLLLVAHFVLGAKGIGSAVRRASEGDGRMCANQPAWDALRPGLAGYREAIYLGVETTPPGGRFCAQYHLLPVLLKRIRRPEQLAWTVQPGQIAVVYAGDDATLDQWVRTVQTRAPFEAKLLRVDEGLALFRRDSERAEE